MVIFSVCSPKIIISNAISIVLVHSETSVQGESIIQLAQGKKWNFLLWDTRLIGRGNAYAPTDFLTIGNAQFPTPIL